VTGTIADLVITTKTVGWRWGIGMWAAIFPVVTVPLAIIFFNAKRRAAKRGLLEGLPKVNIASPKLWLDFFWKIDVVGLVLLAATLSLVLIPFTLAGGVTSLWKTAQVIAPLVIGFCVALPLFIVWETKFARHPLFPSRLLRDRQIYCALAMAALLNTTWYTQGDYLYYTLIVAFDK
jgi:SIT family siderophore-iron:H+ symporter-like MFS transporter